MQRVSLILGCIVLAGCGSMPSPSLTVSFASPTNSLGIVEAHAWIKRVEITGQEVTSLESRAQLENALTNHLWRFLLDGKYFRKVELLPGTPQPEDLVLKFVFDRYQRKEGRVYRSYSYEDLDLSASLTLLRSDGTVVREVRSDVKNRYVVGAPWRGGQPGSTKARTQLVEELLQKALWLKNPVPLLKEPE